MASSLPTRARVSPSSGESHVCNVCCKGFPSRRALNGHMRVHGGHGSTDPSASKLLFESSLLRKCWTCEAPAMEEWQEERDESNAEDHGDGCSRLEMCDGSRLEMCDAKKRTPMPRGTPLEDRSNTPSDERASLGCALRKNPKKNPLLTDKDYVFVQEHDRLSSLYACSRTMCSKTFGTYRGLLQHMQRHSDMVPSPSHAPKSASALTDMSRKDELDPFVEHHGRMVSAVTSSIGRVSVHPNQCVQSVHLDQCVQKLAAHGKHDLLYDAQQPLPTCLVRTSIYEPSFSSRSILASAAKEEQRPLSTVVSDCARREIEAAVNLMMFSEGLTDLVNASESSASAVAPQLGPMDKIKSTDRMQESDLFECQVCGKNFSSYQALGGHTSMHMKQNKSKILDQRTMEDFITQHRHECPICHRVFSKGQALGGHMRRHWTKD